MNEDRHVIVIPDIQAKPGEPLVHCHWISHYVAEKKPDAVVQIGDLYDFPSLSSYDRGTLRAEGKRLELDLIAGDLAAELLVGQLKCADVGGPELYFTEGNHENRLARYLDEHPELEGQLRWRVQAHLEELGFTFYSFLDPLEYSGILFSHFFCRGPSGQVTQTKNGAPNAREQSKREGQSTVAGHRQGLDVAFLQYQSRRTFGVIAGSCYLHEEKYLGPQGAHHWNGIVRLVGVTPMGEAEVCPVSLDFLCRRYQGVPLEKFLRTASDFELMRAPK